MATYCLAPGFDDSAPNSRNVEHLILSLALVIVVLLFLPPRRCLQENTFPVRPFRALPAQRAAPAAGSRWLVRGQVTCADTRAPSPRQSRVRMPRSRPPALFPRGSHGRRVGLPSVPSNHAGLRGWRGSNRAFHPAIPTLSSLPFCLQILKISEETLQSSFFTPDFLILLYLQIGVSNVIFLMFYLN